MIRLRAWRKLFPVPFQQFMLFPELDPFMFVDDLRDDLIRSSRGIKPALFRELP